MKPEKVRPHNEPIAKKLERLSSAGVSGYALLSAYLKMTKLRLSQPFEFSERKK